MRIQSFPATLVLATTICGCSQTTLQPQATVPTMPPDEAFAGLRADLIAVLSNLDPSAADPSVTSGRWQTELSNTIRKYTPSLRPESGLKEYASEDRTFVLVIAANAAAGNRGENASVTNDQAQIVVAIAGDGGDSEGGGGGGGGATANAPQGIALALGGRGGRGRSGAGGGGNAVAGGDGGNARVGGGGGGAAATGGVGSISLGGEGGKGPKPESNGQPGGGTGVENAEEIIEAMNRPDEVSPTGQSR